MIICLFQVNFVFQVICEMVVTLFKIKDITWPWELKISVSSDMQLTILGRGDGRLGTVFAVHVHFLWLHSVLYNRSKAFTLLCVSAKCAHAIPNSCVKKLFRQVGEKTENPVFDICSMSSYEPTYDHPYCIGLVVKWKSRLLVVPEWRSSSRPWGHGRRRPVRSGWWGRWRSSRPRHPRSSSGWGSRR